jgi:hypothetical protein
MSVFFAYIDEAGSYEQARSQQFTTRHPYFLKACVIIPAEQWKDLVAFQRRLLRKCTGSRFEELKWNHLWKLMRRERGDRIRLGRSEKFLESVSFRDAEVYSKNFLSALAKFDAKIVCTITPNIVFHDRVDKKNLEAMHLENLMQRIDMEVNDQAPDSGLAVVFCDRLASSDQERDSRMLYRELIIRSDRFMKYSHLKDSICFVESCDSCGVQLADFVAGAIHGYLRGFEQSERHYALRLYTQLRRSLHRKCLGYGIVDVPRRQRSREHLLEKFPPEHTGLVISNEDDIPF